MRKCGTAQDTVGCTLYKFPHHNPLTPTRFARDGRMRRSPHKFDDGSAALAPLTELIEVCAEGCTTDGCLVDDGSAASTPLIKPIEMCAEECTTDGSLVASVNSATRPPPPLLPLLLWPFAALIFRLLPIADV
uniref:Uncharacterized protein n=1 Tax=Plectus sambesii TaxID=2011161 RepID=A0A914XIG4_9BILA